ncbi:hypothetical protein MBAV_001421 [Candidatus Magnetobacterium bavaricum]|uniref:Uncharacterized protein n=1 Tax=Candidatus Magnetobacterium bavaricum TaxID=29290 RepID=A0A0F3GWV4_9BACT|nr:hypothetical protein MBAV_001421 [Candidatus Magnetobacterium bavaricum]
MIVGQDDTTLVCQLFKQVVVVGNDVGNKMCLQFLGTVVYLSEIKPGIKVYVVYLLG